MTEQTQALVTVGNQPGKLKEYIRSEEIMNRFKDVLGDYQASAYVSSVVLSVANSQQLQECTPLSIVSSALRAASLRLSCDPSTGQAYLVPFKDRGTPKATLIVGYKGLYHMALRTNKYRDINVAAVFEGEEVTEDRITGMHKLEGRRTGDKVIGYIGYFELLAGYRKTVYMTVAEIHEHAQRRSKGYNRPDGAWKTDTAMMEKKTVLRLMLSHWGYFDPHDTMMLDALDAENDGVEILPETVTVVDEPRHDLEELLPLWDNQPQPEKPPLRVDIPAPEAASVKSSNTTDAPAPSNGTPANGNGSARPMTPEALKKAITTKAGKYVGEQISNAKRGVMVGQLNALLGGDENKRHQLTKFLTGYPSTKNMPDNLCHSLIDWMQYDEMAKREANSVIAYLDGQNGQMTLA